MATIHLEGGGVCFPPPPFVRCFLPSFRTPASLGGLSLGQSVGLVGRSFIQFIRLGRSVRWFVRSVRPSRPFVGLLDRSIALSVVVVVVLVVVVCC